jgi:hypothetical protein
MGIAQKHQLCKHSFVFPAAQYFEVLHIHYLSDLEAGASLQGLLM